MMKEILLGMLVGLLVFSLNPQQAAANELTWEEINALISQFDINVETLEMLRDPFMDYRDFSRMETVSGETTADARDAQSPDPDNEGEEQGEEAVPEPDFRLAGLVRRGDAELAVLHCQQEIVLVYRGEEHRGYRFTASEGRRAVFENEGHNFTLEIGG